MSASNKIIQAAAGNVGGYAAGSTDFNGTFQLSSTSAIASDGGQFSLSMWFYVPTGYSAGTLYHQDMDGQFGRYPSIYVKLNHQREISFDINSYPGSGFFRDTSPTNSVNLDEWNHIFISYNSSGPAGNFYLNGDAIGPFTALTSNTIPYSTGHRDTNIGGSNFYSDFGASISEVWIDNSYIDFSSQANREKFVSSDNLPVFLGDDGSEPTGSQPLIYFTLNFSELGSPVGADNLGSVTTFSPVGSGATDGGDVSAYS